MTENLSIIITVVLIAWTTVLTVVLYLIYRHYQRLTKGVKEANLIEVLDNVIKAEKDNSKGISDNKKELERIEKEIGFHIQKVGFVRFNPFNETGGDHSFALSMLDRDLTGFVITGLHTRNRTRIYVKPINKGKCKYSLSKDEQKALKQANKR